MSRDEMFILVMMSFVMVFAGIVIVAIVTDNLKPKKVIESHLRWYDDDNTLIKQEMYHDGNYTALKTGQVYFGNEEVYARIKRGHKEFDTHNFLHLNEKGIHKTTTTVNDIIAPISGRYKLSIEVDMEKGDKFTDMMWSDAVIRKIE